METVIETRALTKRFGDRAAVDGVDLVVPAGVAFGFLGPNGAGKTTLIRTLLGLTSATSGEVSLLGLPQPAKRARGARARRRDRRGAALPPPPDRPREPEDRRGRARPRGRGAHRRVARARRARRSARTTASRRTRSACASGSASRAACSPTRAADPRRADERPRPGRHPRDAAADPRVRRRGPHRLPLVAPARRGREDVRPGRDRRPGPRRPAGRASHEIAATGDPTVLDRGRRRRGRAAGARDRARVAARRAGGHRAADHARATASAPAEVNRALVQAGIAVSRLEPARATLEEKFLAVTSRLEGNE